MVLTGYREMSLRRQESRLAQHNSGAGACLNARSLIPSDVFWAYLSTAPFGENYSVMNNSILHEQQSIHKSPEGTKEDNYRSDVIPGNSVKSIKNGFYRLRKASRR